MYPASATPGMRHEAPRFAGETLDAYHFGVARPAGDNYARVVGVTLA